MLRLIALAPVMLWLWRAVLVGLAIWALVASAKRRRWGWFVVALVFAGAVVAGLFVKESTSPEEAAVERLAPKAHYYATLSAKRVLGAPHVHPGVVTVDVDHEEIDEDVYVDLPNRLQARAPKEVSSVVQIHYGEETVGEYTGGEDAIQEFAKLTIVDLPSGRRYDAGRVEGPEPAAVIPRLTGENSGGPPDPSKVAHRIQDLWKARLKQPQHEGR